MIRLLILAILFTSIFSLTIWTGYKLISSVREAELEEEFAEE